MTFSATFVLFPGFTTGIEVALTVMAQVAGEKTARTIATAIEYDPDPPFGPGTPDAQPEKAGAALAERYRGPVTETAAAFRSRLTS